MFIVTVLSEANIRARRSDRVFRCLLVVAAGLVGLVVGVSMVVLAGRTIRDLGWNVLEFYRRELARSELREILLDTTIIIVSSCLLATAIATVMAWLNERTNASIGRIGRIMPVFPFLMPAIALPLGWLFIAAPKAGLGNVVLRSILNRIGFDLTEGPLDIYSMWALIALYTTILVAFAYMVMGSAMRNLDGRLEEAAQLAGAGPLRVLFQVTAPALKPALISSFLICLLPAVAIVAVPTVIGPGAGITTLSVHIVRAITGRYPPLYGDAFLLGFFMLLPIVLMWLVNRRTAAAGASSLISGKPPATAPVLLRPAARAVGRVVLLGYIAFSVVVPLAGILWVSGLSLWSVNWPDSWSPIDNVQGVLQDGYMREAIFWSLALGLVTAFALMTFAQFVVYGQRVFAKVGLTVDAILKVPAAIANILLAVSVLIAFGGPPLRLGGGLLILFIGYFLGYIPYASVLSTAGQQQIGRELYEASKMSGASEFRTYRRIVQPLSTQTYIAGVVLIFVLVGGELNMSMILGTSSRPVVGLVMLETFEYANFTHVAAFALVVTVVNFCVAAMLLSGLQAGVAVTRQRHSRRPTRVRASDLDGERR